MKSLSSISILSLILLLASCSDGQKRNSQKSAGEVEQAVRYGADQATEQVQQSPDRIPGALEETTDRIDQNALESSREIEIEVDSIHRELE